MIQITRTIGCAFLFCLIGVATAAAAERQYAPDRKVDILHITIDVVSNGRLVSEQIDSESGLKVAHWLQEKPHVNYLVALVAGNFKKIESKYKDIPIAFYTPASLIQYAQNSFKDTADMLEYYEKERQFTSRGFARALDTLAYVSRDEENKTKARKFLIGYVNHPKRSIQSGAIRALGTLGDPKAIGVIETFSGDDPSDRTQRAARDALRAVREKRQLVPDEIVRLRETADKLNKETEKLRNDLEDMKSRLDAKEQGE